VAWLGEDLPRLTGALLDDARHLVEANPTRALAFAAAITLVAFVGWLRAVRRGKHLDEEIKRLRRDLQELDAKYRSELKWRIAAERHEAKPRSAIEGAQTEPQDAARRLKRAPESADAAPLPSPTALEHGARSSSRRYRMLLAAALLLAVVAGAAVVWPELVQVLSPYGTGLISAGLALALASTPLLALMLYFGPSFLAGYQQHARAPAIFAINLCLGWTIVGWLGALAWSTSTAVADDRR
jgi:Superinfection immunity protein